MKETAEETGKREAHKDSEYLNITLDLMNRRRNMYNKLRAEIERAEPNLLIHKKHKQEHEEQNMDVIQEILGKEKYYKKFNED